MGSRKLFTLPTSVIEDLRKEQFELVQKNDQMKFGLIGQAVKPSILEKKNVVTFNNSNILNTTQTEQGNDTTTADHNQ